MKLVTAAILFLSLQGAPRELDSVMQRASAYVDRYMKDLGSIVGEERYFQEARWEDRDIRGHTIKSRRGRQLVSDFLTVPVGEEWIGYRHVRQVDEVALDPLYRGFWREAFDESTPQGREELQRAFTYESTRFNIGDFNRSTNLPTFPLELLSAGNLSIFTFSRAGEEKIGGVETWKIRFSDKGRNTLVMSTSIGQADRFSVSGTLWIEPVQGTVFRVEMDLKHAIREYIDIHMDVRFKPDPELGVLVPASLEEHYLDKLAKHEVEAHGDYQKFRRFNSDVRLDTVWNDAIGGEGVLTQKAEDSFAVKVDVRLVNVEAWVTAASGAPVTDLKAADFNVLENNSPQTITNFSPVSTPYDVLLLFDRSGSTQQDWMAMQKAAEGFISSTRPQDRVGIAVFDTSFRMLTRWADSRDQLAKTVSGLTEGKRPGGTSFYHSVNQALAAEMLPTPSRRRALVVLTDGRDNGLSNLMYRRGYLPAPNEEPAFRQMLELVRRERVPIYIVAISNAGSEVNRMAQIFSQETASGYLNAVGLRLERLAEASGGRVLFPRRLQDIVPLYGQLSRDLGTAFSIGYVSNLPAETQGFREIKVTMPDPHLRVVQSRAGYVAP